MNQNRPRSAEAVKFSGCLWRKLPNEGWIKINAEKLVLCKIDGIKNCCWKCSIVSDRYEFKKADWKILLLNIKLDSDIKIEMKILN